MRKLFTLIFCLGAISLGVFFARDSLLVWSAKSALNRHFPGEVVTKHMTAKRGVLSIEKMHAHANEVDLSLTQMTCSLSLKQMLQHPKSFWKLYRQGIGCWTDLLFFLQECGVELTVEQGSIQIDEDRFYFQIKHAEKSNDMTVSVATELAALACPQIVALITSEQEGTQVQLSINQVATDKLLQLASLVDPATTSTLAGSRGKVQLHGAVSFGVGGHIEKFATRFSLHDVALSSAKMGWGFQVDHAAGNISYPEGINHEGFPLWKRVQCGLIIEEGNILLKDQLSLAQINGEMILDPHQDPALDLSGQLLGREYPLGLHLGGRGAVHDDRAYWLEFTMDLDDHRGTQCGAVVSICSPETDTLIAQLEADNLLPNQFEMVRKFFTSQSPAWNQYEVLEGHFYGKMISVWEKGKLAQLQIEPFSGKNVLIATPNGSHFLAEVEACGSAFGQLQLKATLPTTELLGAVNGDLQMIYLNYRPKEMAIVEMTFEQLIDQVAVSAQVELGETEQTLQFGYRAPSLFPADINTISGGWLYAEGLSHLVYGPLIRLFHEDLEIYGTLDLVASLERGKIEGALQIQDFLAKSPLFDLKSTAIGQRGVSEGRARFVYDCNTHSLEGKIPLTQARIYDRQYGLCLKEVDAQLAFNNKTLLVQVDRSAISFDHYPLLENASFSIQYDGAFSLDNFKGHLCLPTDKDYQLHVTHFDAKHCEVALFDQTEQLATFKGEHNDHWIGNFTNRLFANPLDIHLHWDPIANFARLSADQEGLHIECTKQDNTFSLENLSFGQTHVKGVCKKEGEKYYLSELAWNRPDLTIESTGSFSLALPTKATFFEVKGNLSMATHLKGEIDVTLKASQPFAIAYSPGLGFAVSGLSLCTDGCSVNVSQLEWKEKEQATFAQGLSCALSSGFIHDLVEKGVFPSLLQDFTIFDHVVFRGSASKNPETFELRAVADQREDPFSFTYSSNNKGQMLTLKDEAAEETLSIGGTWKGKDFAISTLKGSFFGLTANLKKEKKEKLKGSVQIDTRSMSKFFSLSNTPLFPIWHLGKSFRLEGVFHPAERLENWSYKGKVKGEGLQIFDQALNSMQAKVVIEPSRIQVDSVDLTDDAAKLWISEGTFQKDTGGRWHYTFPQVELRNVQPLLLKERQSKPSAFSIKSATFKEVRGVVDDRSTLNAVGNFHFSNWGKKGDKMLPNNFPISALRQMGIEPAIFIPVTGEGEIVVGNEKFFITKVEGIFSEKKRFAFTQLKNSPIGYVDFEGNLFLDLQAKQAQKRGSASSVVCKIRGNLLDPTFTVR